MLIQSRKKTLALAIWWCEGTKLRREKRWKNSFIKAVEVTNCNPEIIRIFVDYLKDDLKVPSSKIKGQLQVHEGDDIDKIEKFWELMTGIPRSQFNKTIVRVTGNKPGKSMGTFKVRVYGAEVFDNLAFLLKKELKGIITIDGV